MDDKNEARLRLRQELENGRLTHLAEAADMDLLSDMLYEASEAGVSLAESSAGRAARAALRGELVEAMKNPGA